MIWEGTRVERERSDGGRRGLKAGQFGGWFCSVLAFGRTFDVSFFGGIFGFQGEII